MPGPRAYNQPSSQLIGGKLNKKLAIMLAGSMLLVGCSAPAAAAPAPTVTVTVTASAAPAQPAMTSAETCQQFKAAVSNTGSGQAAAKYAYNKLKPVAERSSAALKDALDLYVNILEEKAKDAPDDAKIRTITSSPEFQTANDNIRNLCGSS